MVVTIEREMPERDAAPVEALFDATFGPGHFAKTAERLREFGHSLPDLTRVARSGDMVVGVCRIWPIRIGCARSLFVGPVAVDPAWRGDWMGLQVTGAALDACKAAGFPHVLLIGAMSYFGRIGFEAAPIGSITLPGPQDPRRILVKRLRGDAPFPEGAARSGFG